MRILVVTRDAPMPAWGGGRGARNTYLLRALCEAHRVTLLIVTDDLSIAARDGAALDAGLEALRIVGAPLSRYKRAWQVASAVLRQPSVTLRFSPPVAGRAIRALLVAERFDAVVYQSVTVADHRLPPGPRVVIDEHNLEFELMERSATQAGSMLRRVHYALEAAALKRVELGLLARTDLVSVTSERERDLLGALLPGARVVVTTNGVNTEAFAPNPEWVETPERVIFTGSMDYHPNEQAAHYFADSIWPRVRAEVPDATWYLVGARPPASFKRLATLPGVTVTGTVAETQPYLAAAAVAIAPLLVGGGTRLKILEALAMGKAVVTTALGCEGLDVTSGEHLLVADDPGQFAHAVIELMRDDARRARLGAAGRALVEREYSWARSGRALVQAVERCVAERGREGDVAAALGERRPDAGLGDHQKHITGGPEPTCSP
ncbi:MAG: hypothetical protein JWQ86_1258 [Mycobacterium sp.]|jgi:glycosyltransferase involved in cell wall biosynthesis|nr:hypothetical protein [Mycobacterium sp.]